MITKLLIAVTALSVAGLDTASAHVYHHKGAHRAHHRIAHRVSPVMEYVPASAYIYPGARPVWAAPQSCWIEEGYGRFFPCGGGPSIH